MNSAEHRSLELHTTTKHDLPYITNDVDKKIWTWLCPSIILLIWLSGQMYLTRFQWYPVNCIFLETPRIPLTLWDFSNIWDLRDIRDLWDIRDIRDIRDLRDIKDIRNIRDLQDILDLRDIKDTVYIEDFLYIRKKNSRISQRFLMSRILRSPILEKYSSLNMYGRL